jgi:hypothetical protein
MGEERILHPISAITIVFIMIAVMFIGVISIVPENNSATPHVGSTSGNEIWLEADNPHNIWTDFTVNAGHTLVVEPGVEIRFKGDYTLTVLGKLYANGTGSQRINITYRVGGWSTSTQWKQILFDNGSSGILMNCDITRGTTSTALPLVYIDTNENVTVDNCSFAHNPNKIIYVEKGSHEILNNTISSCTDGITIMQDNSTVMNNTVKGSTIGINLAGGSPDVSENNLTKCTTGIEISGGTASIHDNGINLSQKGAYLKSATNFKFNNNVLDSCEWSFYTENSATVENCTIINSTEYNFYLTGGAHNIYSLNMSYNDTNSIASLTNLYKQWYLQLKVKDIFNDPINKANLAITDLTPSTVNYKTKPNGWVNWVRATEKVFLGSSTPTARTPHTITASKGSGFNSTTFTPNIIQSMTLVFKIKDTQKPSSSTDSISYWYKTSNVILDFSAADNTNLKNISLYYNHSTTNATSSFSVLKKADSTTLNGASDSGTFDFNFINGEGYYRFYTRAADKTNNIENLPLIPDSIAGFDETSPEFIESNHTNLTEDSTGSCRVNITINDSLSGIAELPKK